MRYSFESKVRYSEMDAEGRLSLHGVLNYFQDCSTFQSEEIGQGVEALKARKRVWVLSSWQVVLERYPTLGEKLIVQTWPYEFKGFLGSRNFLLKTAQGERLAYANSLWSNLNTETGVPARLTTQDTAGYQIEEKLDMNYAPRRIQVPEADVKKKEAFPVIREYLDTNHHVNNAQYVALAQNYLPEGFVVKQLRAEYKRQAVLGNMFYPKVAAITGGYMVVLDGEDGSPYAILEFLGQKA